MNISHLEEFPQNTGLRFSWIRTSTKHTTVKRKKKHESIYGMGSLSVQADRDCMIKDRSEHLDSHPLKNLCFIVKRSPVINA